MRVGKMSRITLLLGVILVLFGILAIPLAFHEVGDIRQLAAFSPVSTDESRMVNIVMKNLQAGWFGAHEWYVYGGFYFMLCLGGCYPLQLLTTLDEPTVLIISRLISTLFGVLSLLILYVLGRRLFDEVTALLATIVMVVSWVFVSWSASDHPDLPQMFFLTMALYGCVRLIETPAVSEMRILPKWLFFAGLCGALAFSIKYAGIFILPVVWLAYVLSWVGGLSASPGEHNGVTQLSVGQLTRHGLNLCLVALLFPVVFFVTTPYALTNLGEFLGQTTFNTKVVSTARFAVDVPGTVWLQEIASARMLGLGLSVLVLVYIGTFLVHIVRRSSGLPITKHARLIVLIWAAFYFGFLYWAIDLHPPHYLLPIFPVLCLFAARGLLEVWRWRPGRKELIWLARAVIVLVFAQSLFVRGQEVLAFYRGRMSFSFENHATIRAGMWLERAFPPDTIVCSDASYNYVPKAFDPVPIDRWREAGVVLVNRTSAGTFDDPALAEGFVSGRDVYLAWYEFYRMFLNGDYRPPSIVEIRDFGPVIVYLNIDGYLGNGQAQPHGGSEQVVFPARQIGTDALYAFSSQDSEEAHLFESTWGGYVAREEVHGLNGEALATVFRVRNADLPEADSPLDLFSLPRFKKAPVRMERTRFVEGPELLGYSVLDSELDANETLDVDLYWHGKGKISKDYTVFIHALDEYRRVQGIGDRRPLNGRYPTYRWRDGDVIIERFSVPLSPCAPTSEYRLNVGLYSLDTGERLPLEGPLGGTSLLLGPFDLSPSNEIALGDVPPSSAVQWSLPGQSIQLVGFEHTLHSAKAGQRVPFNLYWQTTDRATRSPEIPLSLEVGGQTSWVLWQGLTGDGVFIREDGPLPLIFCQPIDVELPLNLPSGQYDLTLVGDGNTIEVGTLEVEARNISRVAPQPDQPAEMMLGDGIRYLGYDGLAGAVSAGSEISFTLYWQAVRSITESYKVFVHFVDEHGKILTQIDQAPVVGNYPTSDWIEDEFIADPYTLTVPNDIAPGTYGLLVGMYDELTGQRLAIPTSETNTLLISEVQIE